MLRIYDPELHNAVKIVVDHILAPPREQSVEAYIKQDLKAREAAQILKQLLA